MPGLRLAATLAALMLATPVGAQVTCRPNALGAETCVGVPAPSRSREPYVPRTLGIRGVQAPAGAESGGKLTAAGRTDVLGNTFLTARDLPPNRPLPNVSGPRNCARDALDNLICR